jgi:hypothetical protein
MNIMNNAITKYPNDESISVNNPVIGDTSTLQSRTSLFDVFTQLFLSRHVLVCFPSLHSDQLLHIKDGLQV